MFQTMCQAEGYKGISTETTLVRVNFPFSPSYWCHQKSLGILKPWPHLKKEPTSQTLHLIPPAQTGCVHSVNLKIVSNSVLGLLWGQKRGFQFLCPWGPFEIQNTWFSKWLERGKVKQRLVWEQPLTGPCSLLLVEPTPTPGSSLGSPAPFSFWK